QAEDGIRDFHVTGVQTCALPILYAGDMIYNVATGVAEEQRMIDPYDFTRQFVFDDSYESEDLLVPIYREGKIVYQLPSISDIRKRVNEELSRLLEGSKRFENPHTYEVGLEKTLFDLKTKLILAHRYYHFST